MDLARKETQEAAITRMRDLRRHFRYRQQECAAALGISQAAYADMEYGRSRVRRRDLVTLAVLYGLTPEAAFPGLVELPKGRPTLPDLTPATERVA